MLFIYEILVIFKGDDHQPTTCGIPGGNLEIKTKLLRTLFWF
jgi:hypothetical protein